MSADTSNSSGQSVTEIRIDLSAYLLSLLTIQEA